MTLVENMNHILASDGNLVALREKNRFAKRDLYVPFYKSTKKRSKSEKHLEKFIIGLKKSETQELKELKKRA